MPNKVDRGTHPLCSRCKLFGMCLGDPSLDKFVAAKMLYCDYCDHLIIASHRIPLSAVCALFYKIMGVNIAESCCSSPRCVEAYDEVLKQRELINHQEFLQKTMQQGAQLSAHGLNQLRGSIRGAQAAQHSRYNQLAHQMQSPLSLQLGGSTAALKGLIPGGSTGAIKGLIPGSFPPGKADYLVPISLPAHTASSSSDDDDEE